MKPVNRFLNILIVLLFSAIQAIGQQGGPGAKWTGAIDFGSNPGYEDAWAFSAAELPNGDIVAVGYVTDAGVRKPGFAWFSKDGELLGSKIFKSAGGPNANAEGAFYRIAVLSNGDCLLVGNQNFDPGGEQSFAGRLKPNLLDSPRWTSRFEMGSSADRDRIFTIQEASNGAIFVGGGVRGGIPFIVQLNGTNGDATALATNYFAGFNGQINDFKIITAKGTFPNPDNHYLIFTGFKTFNEAGWEFEIKDLPDCDNKPSQTRNSDNTDLTGQKYWIRDNDVFYGRIDLDNNLNEVLDEHTYNSKAFCYSIYGVPPADVAPPNPATPGLWKELLCNGQPSDQFGPCTPPNSVDNWGSPGSGSPVADHFLANNSTDQGTSIMYSDATGLVYIVAELNTFQITSGQSGNGDIQHDGPEKNPDELYDGDGVLLKNYCDQNIEKEYHDYKDGYVFVMKLDLNGTLLGSSNVAHFSGGGWLLTNNAVFSNCGIGVLYNRKYFASSLPTLNNTTFEFLGKLADPSYEAFISSPGEPVGPELGCMLRSIQDVRFSNVRFVNTGPDNLYDSWRNKPSGIYAIDSYVKATHSGTNANFENLFVGVETASLGGGVTTTAYISAIFDKVYQGANLRASLAPTVVGSRFENIPDADDLVSDGTPFGVFTADAQGVLLDQNDFFSNAGFDSYGAILRNTLGTGGAEMRHNKFTDFNRANQFEKDNSSIFTKCNDYLGAVGDMSWRVKGEFASQGGQGNNKPDNGFFSDCSSFLLDIDNSFTSPFSYFERYPPISTIDWTVQCVENVNVIRDLSTEATLRNCVIEPPCPMQPCTTLTEKYIQTGKLLQYRNQLLHAYANWEGGVNQDSSNLVSTDAAIALLLDRNQEEDKRQLVATYTALGNYSEAQTRLQQVGGTDTETADFVQYYSVLISAGLAGRDPYHLSDSEFQQVADLMTHSSTVSENVRVLDHILNGRYHPLAADETEEGARSEPPSRQNDLALKSLQVFPNPFLGRVQFVAPGNTEITGLTITDISGKVVFEHKQVNTTLLWTSKSHHSGIYLYTCTLSNGEILQGKLIKTTNE